MDLETLIAQWSGQLPPGFVPHAVIRQKAPQCVQPRCRDFLCERCREDRDAERAQKRQDAHDAAAIDEFAAKPDCVHKASNLDCGISPLMPRS